MKLSLTNKIFLLLVGAIVLPVLLFAALVWNSVASILSSGMATQLESKSGTWISLGVFLVLLASLIALAWVLSKLLTRPLHSLIQYLALMEEGVIPNEIRIDAQDELGQMAEQLHNVAAAMNRSAHFSNEIGKGNFEMPFESLGQEDVLGNALLEMRLNLQEAENKEAERDWINQGVARVSEILRTYNTLNEIAELITKYMCERIDAVQGAFFISEDKETGRVRDNELLLAYLYAYNRKKHLEGKYRFGEGLIGQAAIEQYTIYRREIPRDYTTINSGILGDARPESLLIVPFISDDIVYGVMEFASVHDLNPAYQRFADQVAPIIARTIFNIKVNERTRRLLEESQRMSSELGQQQQELQENAVEMQATQEELQRSNKELEVQMQEVSNAQNRMQQLLLNASEIITIYEEDGTIRYVSPSVTRILGYESDEFIGVRGRTHVYEEDIEVSRGMFKGLIEEPDQEHIIQYRFKRKDGEWIWLEANGKNLMKDQSVKGIVINARDITLKRKAEFEERMRRNMQALSENSPDLISRISQGGNLAYINPVLSEYADLKPEELQGHNISEVPSESGLKEMWESMVEEASALNDKVLREVHLNTPSGERIVLSTAIPEYLDEKLESVLIVSHDITERKIIELEIQDKNKKIHESITYSKRIQNAIVPDNKLIQTLFDDSFIFYKPRDIVSGDFPWILTKDDDIYLAAVDCTGHGVPGAMLSLVGCFLLNDSIETSSLTQPGLILDRFDQKVNSRLVRGEADEQIKDGMDLAFCHINKKKKLLEFSGAHRPLYFITDGQLVEYKGNKWAIGGGVYKNQTNFDNHVIPYKKGDSFFIFSDGLPDQFGGPQNRKFGPQRIKDILINHQTLPLSQLYKVFADEFEGWMGNQKQMDDVLLIGVRF
jgi:PAS domain S-box-containing protein